jgi:hypothetical protein
MSAFIAGWSSESVVVYFALCYEPMIYERAKLMSKNDTLLEQSLSELIRKAIKLFSQLSIRIKLVDTTARK